MRISILLAVFSIAAASASEIKPRNRIVRVVSVSQADLRTGPQVMEETLERLELSTSFQPDIACLPELFVEGEPEAIPGPVTKRLGAWAQRNSSYVIFGIKAQVGSRVCNSAVLLDRNGQVSGRYDKMHPTEKELASGTYPGPVDPPVFETDFGTIGVQICFDVNWWDNWTRLKEKGAKIVFFPAAYPAAKQLSAIALMNQFFVVSSTQSRLSRIYDITGDELATSGRFEPYAAAAIPIGKTLFEIDFHTAKVRELQKKYGPKVEVVWHHEDDWFTLASLEPDLTVKDLIQEFGLVPLNEYHVRAKKAIDAARRSSE
jgi:predicted amidohydrolase